MEELHVQNLGTVAIQPVILENELDKKFKPGLYMQVKSFLSGSWEDLCTISEQVKMVKLYEKMANYTE
jgi:hypothetical protein